MNKGGGISQRLLRKGALVAETYKLFSSWDQSASLDKNLEKGLQGEFTTDAWGREVQATLRRRFQCIPGTQELVRLAVAGLPLEEWRSCLLLWIGIYEPLFGDFVRDWLFSESANGTYQMRTEDVEPYVVQYWKRVSLKPLSSYGATRTARDLLRMGVDLRLLQGNGPAKSFASHHLTDRCFVYWAHVISEVEGSASRLIESRAWRLAMMDPAAVENALLRLHQFRKLEYEVAGSLVQITLPCRSSSEYVERMAS
jgi:hypothetical protein